MQSQFLTAVGAFVSFTRFLASDLDFHFQFVTVIQLAVITCLDVVPYHVSYFQVGTFMGIAIHNLSALDGEIESLDLTAGVRQTASGLLGTTVQFSDLVGDRGSDLV
jgi:hypothetical protein